MPDEFSVNRQVVRKRAETRAVEPDPATRMVVVTVPEPDMSRPLGDADRLAAAVEQVTGLHGVSVDPALLPRVQPVLRAGNWRATAAVHQDVAAPVVIGLRPGAEDRTAFGVALDIGSTTIAGSSGRPRQRSRRRPLRAP